MTALRPKTGGSIESGTSGTNDTRSLVTTIPLVRFASVPRDIINMTVFPTPHVVMSKAFVGLPSLSRAQLVGMLIVTGSGAAPELPFLSHEGGVARGMKTLSILSSPPG